jgi:hypothetical protein
MKKIILLACGLIIITVAADAQAGFRLGIKGGANLTRISGQSFNESYKLGYQLGGFAEIDFSELIGIQPEVLFSESNGRTASGTNPLYAGLNGSQDIKLNYLSIPVLLRLNVCKLVTLNVGPQYSILVNNHKTTLQNGQDAFKNGDFAMVGGVQLNLDLLRIYARYNIGLSDINDIDNQDKWKNQQLQLGVGIRF